MALVSPICDECIIKSDKKKVINIAVKSEELYDVPCANCKTSPARKCVWRHNCSKEELKEGYCEMMDQFVG